MFRKRANAPEDETPLLIEAEPDGFPRLQPQLALLDCRLPEFEVKQDYPALWRYLERGEVPPGASLVDWQPKVNGWLAKKEQARAPSAA